MSQKKERYLRFPGGKKKALTLSYDDGMELDAPLVEMLRKAGMKCTFNISTGMFWPEDKEKKQSIYQRMTKAECQALYTDDVCEIAIHGYDHLDLPTLDTATACCQIVDDRRGLEEAFDRQIHGMAYPYGTTNDDMVSLTTIDEPHAEVTVGEIANIYIHNVCAYNGYSGIRLLSAGNFAIKNVHINGVYGDYRHNAVLVSHHYTRPNTKIWFDDIVIEHVHASKSHTPLGEDCFTYWEGECRKGPVIWFEEGICCGRVTLRDISRHEIKDTPAYLVQLDEKAVIGRLVAENISQTTDPGVTAPLWFDRATVGTRILRDIDR